MASPPPLPLLARFEQRLPADLSDDKCWLWQGCIESSHGYGTIRQGGAKSPKLLAHRVAWEAHHAEPIPPGMCVCHVCDKRPCVNPTHLFLGTISDNMADKLAKGRQARGTTHHRAKLTDSQVLEIRLAYESGKETQESIAQRFQISRPSVSLIVNRKTWRHLP